MLNVVGHILMGLAAMGSLVLLLPLAALLTRNDGLSRFTNGLATLFNKIVTGVGGVVIWAVLAMALVQVAVVVMRYVFGLNFIWLQEVIVYLFGATFLLLGGYVLIREGHVRVDVFYREMSDRRKAWVDFIGTYLFLFPICLLIIWAAGPYVARSWAVMEPSAEPSGLPFVYLLKSLIPAFSVLLAMAGFERAARAVAILQGREAA